MLQILTSKKVHFFTGETMIDLYISPRRKEYTETITGQYETLLYAKEILSADPCELHQEELGQIDAQLKTLPMPKGTDARLRETVRGNLGSYAGWYVAFSMMQIISGKAAPENAADPEFFNGIRTFLLDSMTATEYELIHLKGLSLERYREIFPPENGEESGSIQRIAAEIWEDIRAFNEL